MTEFDVAQYADSYFNSVFTSAKCLCSFYFFMGIVFCIVSQIVIRFIFNMIWDLIEAKRQNKESEDEK